MEIWRPEAEVMRAAEIKGIEMRTDQQRVDSTNLRGEAETTTRKRRQCAVRRLVVIVAAIATILFTIIMYA